MKVALVLVKYSANKKGLKIENRRENSTEKKGGCDCEVRGNVLVGRYSLVGDFWLQQV